MMKVTAILLFALGLPLRSAADITIYYDNSATKWSKVKIHYWDNPSTTWSGVDMTQINNGTIWKYTFTQDVSTLKGFLFNNGTGSGDANQTDDYKKVPVDKHLYKGAGGNKGAVTDCGVYQGDDPDPNPNPNPNPDPEPEPDPEPDTDACYWLDPAKPSQNDHAVLHFNATKDGGKLKDQNEVWVYIGLITSKSTGDKDWKHVQATHWNSLDDKCRMTKDASNPNLYTLDFTHSIAEWFGMFSDEKASKIAVIFRTKDGETQQHANDQFITLKPAPIDPIDPTTSPLGKFQSFSDDNTSVTVQAEKGKLIITPYAPEVVRILTLKNNASKTEPRKSIAVKSSPAATYSTDENDERLDINISGGITVRVAKNSSLVSYLDADDKLILAENKGMENSDGSHSASFLGAADAAFYGGGYNGTYGNIDGMTITMRNTQTGNWHADDQPPHNINVPVCVSSNGYGLFFDDVYNNSTLTPSAGGTVYRSNSTSPIAYYFMGGGSMEKVMENYTWLTGRQDMPPYWALGYITSRYGYRSASEACDIINGIKGIDIPLDGIVFDLFWQGSTPAGMGNLNWDKTTFSDPKGMMKEFKDKGIATICITEPFFTSNSKNYNTLKDKGYFADDDVSNMSWLQSDKVGLLDATNPDALKWMNDFYTARTREGVTGWWLDLGEPEQHDPDSQHKGGTYNEIHNEFGNLWVEATYNNLKENFPNQRQFLMPRAATAGIQRYSAFPWTGDIQRSWKGLQAQVPALVNAAMSGIGYLGSDIGGFITEGHSYDNLYLRWVELGVFYPMMRTHCDLKSFAEPHLYPNVKDDVRKFINMRYSYLPYTYTLSYFNSRYGTPLARPANANDAYKPRLADSKNSYLWGRDIYVAPVMEENAVSRSISFPDGVWYDLNNPAKKYEGGRATSAQSYSAPLNTLPAFARGGSFITRFGQDAYTNTASIDRSKLRIDYYYPSDDAANLDCWHYEDDHATPDPVAGGKYRLTHMRAYNILGSPTFSFTREGNGYDGEPASQEIRLTFHGVRNINDIEKMFMVDQVPAGETDRSVRNAEANGLVDGDSSVIGQCFTQEQFENAAHNCYYLDTANKQLHAKLNVAPSKHFELGLQITGIPTGLESLTGGDIILEYADGMISYSLDGSYTGAGIDIYNLAGIHVAHIGSLAADGMMHQTPLSIPAGTYIATLTASTPDAVKVSKKAKFLAR